MAFMTASDIDIGSQEDFVHLKVDDREVQMHYEIAKKLLRGWMICASRCALYENATSPWSQLGDFNAMDDLIKEPIHPCYRQSGRSPNFKRWKIEQKGSLIATEFDTFRWTFHWGDLLKIGSAFRAYGLNAKRWAGDMALDEAANILKH